MMTVMDSISSISYPSPNPSCASLPFKNRPSSSMAACTSPSLRFYYQLRPRSSGVSALSGTGAVNAVAAQGLGLRFLSPRISLKPSSVVPFAASHEESKHHSEIEKEKDDLKMGAQESQEAWKETLASFKEQALKMQNISQEAYDIYSKKAVVILKETSEQLKIQADKARHDLSVIAKEISEEGKEYISTAKENSPESVKEVVDTFTSSVDDINDISTVRDYTVGIPYGLVLSLGGFLSFMITGSIPAIRFGVILGGALLALSISSLKAQKRGKPLSLALEGQAAIAGILFLRQIQMLSQRSSFPNILTTIISGGMVGFYVYRILQDRKGPNLEHGTEN